MLLLAFKVMEAIEIVTHNYLNTEQIEARKLIYSDLITNVLQVTMCWRLSERSLYFFNLPISFRRSSDLHDIKQTIKHLYKYSCFQTIIVIDKVQCTGSSPNVYII